VTSDEGARRTSWNRVSLCVLRVLSGESLKACGGTTEGKSRGPACGDATPGGVQGLHEEEVTGFTRRVFILGKVASLRVEVVEATKSPVTSDR